MLAVDVVVGFELAALPRLNPPKSGFCPVPGAAGAVEPEACGGAGAKGDGLLTPADSGIEGLENKFDVVCAGGCAPNRGVEAAG